MDRERWKGRGSRCVHAPLMFSISSSSVKVATHLHRRSPPHRNHKTKKSKINSTSEKQEQNKSRKKEKKAGEERTKYPPSLCTPQWQPPNTRQIPTQALPTLPSHTSHRVFGPRATRQEGRSGHHVLLRDHRRWRHRVRVRHPEPNVYLQDAGPFVMLLSLVVRSTVFELFELWWRRGEWSESCAQRGGEGV
jgi:hypothetical protein